MSIAIKIVPHVKSQMRVLKKVTENQTKTNENSLFFLFILHETIDENYKDSSCTE
jgi:hypothetical protein